MKHNQNRLPQHWFLRPWRPKQRCSEKFSCDIWCRNTSWKLAYWPSDYKTLDWTWVLQTQKWITRYMSIPDQVLGNDHQALIHFWEHQWMHCFFLNHEIVHLCRKHTDSSLNKYNFLSLAYTDIKQQEIMNQSPEFYKHNCELQEIHELYAWYTGHVLSIYAAYSSHHWVLKLNRRSLLIGSLRESQCLLNAWTRFPLWVVPH